MATAQGLNHQVEILEELDPRQMKISATNMYGKAKLQYMQFCLIISKITTASREAGMMENINNNHLQRPLGEGYSEFSK